MSKAKHKTIWWSQMTVIWADESNQEQVVFLPESEARQALQWLRAMGSSTWEQVAEVAPDLEDELRDLTEELDWEGDEFHFDEIPAYHDGDLPPSPNSLMERALPGDFISSLGVGGDTVLSGPTVTIPTSHLINALMWLERHGYSAEEHPELADLGRDPADFLPS